MYLAENLRQLRLQEGLSLKQVATCLNLSVGTISNYERGIHEPDVDALCQFANLYGVTTDFLLGHHTDITSRVIYGKYTVGRLLALLPHLSDQDRRLLTYQLQLLEKVYAAELV